MLLALTFYFSSGCHFKVQQQNNVFFIALDKRRTVNQAGVGAIESRSQWCLPRTISVLFGRRDSAGEDQAALFNSRVLLGLSCRSAFLLPECSSNFFATQIWPTRWLLAGCAGLCDPHTVSQLSTSYKNIKSAFLLTFFCLYQLSQH